MNKKFKEFFYESTEPIKESMKTAVQSIAAAAMLGANTLSGIGAAKEPNRDLNNKTQISSTIKTGVQLNEIDWEKLFKSLQDMETSTSKIINGKYFGDQDEYGVYRAYGPLQIWNIIVNDVNKIYQTKYTHEDAHNLVKAKDICKKYLINYIKEAQRNLKRPLTYQEIGMLWNGGPNGYKSTKPNRLDYGERFQNLMMADKDGFI